MSAAVVETLIAEQPARDAMHRGVSVMAMAADHIEGAGELLADCIEAATKEQAVKLRLLERLLEAVQADLAAGAEALDKVWLITGAAKRRAAAE